MSKSNPMHRTECGHTIRSPKKEERAWQDLQKEKRAYIKRLQEDEDAEAAKRMWREVLRKQREDEENYHNPSE